MIWAGMRGNGEIHWRFIDDYYVTELTVNRFVYLRLLMDVLPEIYEGGQSWVQDNAKPHQAHIVRQFLDRYGIWVLPHPAKSPDLNAIEHLWLRLKETVHRLHPELAEMGLPGDVRMQLFRDAIREAFEELQSIEDWDLPERLARSMPRRLEAVRRAHGAQTKY